MRNSRAKIIALFGLAILAGCTGASFKSVWRAENEASWQLSGRKTAALVVTDLEAVRRNSEEIIAEEINRQGGVGHAGYKMVKEERLGDIEGLISASKTAGMEAALLIRIAFQDSDPRCRSAIRVGIGYGGFRGRYGGIYDGWYDVPESVATVETRFYELKEGRILWTGVTEWSHSTLDERAVGEIARASFIRMFRDGVLTR